MCLFNCYDADHIILSPQRWVCGIIRFATRPLGHGKRSISDHDRCWCSHNVEEPSIKATRHEVEGFESSNHVRGVYTVRSFKPLYCWRYVNVASVLSGENTFCCFESKSTVRNAGESATVGEKPLIYATEGRKPQTKPLGTKLRTLRPCWKSVSGDLRLERNPPNKSSQRPNHPETEIWAL